ncbi:MAG: aminopeptidase P family N-terminal domain-containing protein, partial [Rhodococcus sp. (in: high G+C Gram-positive bacteria)]
MSSDSTSSPTRFATEIYASRLARAAEYAGQAGLDALLVTPGPDLQYLIGSRASSFERLICLVIPADGSSPTVIVPRIELAALEDSAVGDLGLMITDWVDGVSPYALVAAILPSGARTAVDDAMPALHFVPLAEKLGRTPILATAVLRQLRMS